MKKFSSIFVVLTGLLAITGPAAWAGAAKMSTDPGRVQWDAQVEYERAVLTVSMPGGEVVRQEFDARQALIFDLATVEGAKDGAYKFELRLMPQIDASLRKALADARKSGDEAAMARLRAQLPESAVQSGGFMVQAGTVVMQEGREPQGDKKSATAAGSVRNVTAEDQVIPDDLIVQGSACVGLDCVNNENFGFDTIRLKENNLRIHFDDTSTQAGFPANDWRLIANDSAGGGISKFSIEDSTGARTPFTVEAGATTNSIYVDSTGRVGFRTSTPVLDLHVNTSNTPSIRLEQNNSGGFTAQTWDVAGNEANFFVRDVTGGSRLPFRIRPGAPTSSIDISADGDVGIGTAGPESKLHVFGGNTSDVIVGMGPNPDGSPGTESAFNLFYAGATIGRAAAILNVRPDSGATAPNPSLRFWTANVEHMIIDNQGFVGLGGIANPTSPIHHLNGATLSAGGAWLNGSSRGTKQDIAELAADEALSTLQNLAPVKFAYKVDPNEGYVGFIAEDVPALVATSDRKNLSSMDIVAVLTKVVQEQQKTIDELAAKVAELEKKK
ncbi:MAG TPA: tail fiber domain-containing protein [Thermoanaerobaculia bacterium]|nr:tail fiber domain-containing protein [Thermoanaerobaculia bacterium]